MLGINLTSLHICAELADKLSQRGYSLTSSTGNLNGTYCSIELNTDLKLYRFTEYNPAFYNWLFSDVEAVDLIPDEALAHYLNPSQKENSDLQIEIHIHFIDGYTKRMFIR